MCNIDTRFETCNETSFLTVQRLSAATILFMCSNVYQNAFAFVQDYA